MSAANLIQGSEEWLRVRLGKVTASRVADVVAKTKSGYGASRVNYMAELVAERLTGASAERYTNAAMQWGTATEAEARAAYAFHANADVTEVGFLEHPTIPMAGASPDGLVGSDGLVEFKCPNTATHIETLRGSMIAGKYITQVQWQMACAPGRMWCDWVSYDPRLPERMRVFIKRVPRDEAMISELESEVRGFLAELDRTIADLSSRYGAQPQEIAA